MIVFLSGRETVRLGRTMTAGGNGVDPLAVTVR
jgi:hypothetical protein